MANGLLLRYVGAYRLFFDDLTESVGFKSNLEGYFLTVTVVSAAASLVGLLFLRYPMLRFHASINSEDTTSQRQRLAKQVLPLARVLGCVPADFVRFVS